MIFPTEPGIKRSDYAIAVRSASGALLLNRRGKTILIAGPKLIIRSTNHTEDRAVVDALLEIGVPLCALPDTR